jgi:ABC-2 type transport system permease protein
VLCERLLDDLLANPGSIVLTLIFGLGFLITYDGQLGGATAIGLHTGGSYLAFIVPTGVLVASFAAAAAGYLLARDIEDGYADRLATLPLSPLLVAGAPMLVGAAYAVAQAAVVLAVGAVLGAWPVTGFAGAVAILALAGLWGTGVAGYMTAAAILAREAEIMRLVDLSLFALLFFFSPILLPLDQLASWLRPLAQLNPASYMLDGIRALMIEGWVAGSLAQALASGLGFTAAALAVATYATRRGIRG